MSTIEAIELELRKLSPQQQQSVLDYARSIVEPLPHGTKASALAKFAGTISAEDLHQMQLAIEEACERVSTDAG